MRRFAAACCAAAALVGPARGQMGGAPEPQGGGSMYPIDFDGDGDIDIVKSSPIGIIWLENHGTNEQWETHIISLNQNIKDAVAMHKREKKFIRAMEDVTPAECALDGEADEIVEEAVVLVGDSSISIGGGDDPRVSVTGGPSPLPDLYAEASAHAEL